MHKERIFIIFILILFLVSCTNNRVAIGHAGGVFAKSGNNDDYYFIVPHSLNSNGARFYTFDSLEDLINHLPQKYNYPPYWFNYTEKFHNRLKQNRYELKPLNNDELIAIEKHCYFSNKIFMRSGDKEHPLWDTNLENPTNEPTLPQ